MTNATLGVRRRVDATRNAHGERVAAGWGPVVGPAPGRTRQNADASWGLGLDPDLWPIRQGDLVIGADGGSWLVTSANLITNNVDSQVDWVRVIAAHRTSGGATEPGGGWFVARYDDYVEPPPLDPPPPPSRDAAGLWTGWGPPPAVSNDFWPQVGDEYLDLYTGTIYRLGAS